jgi:hypothetical protein
MNRILILSVLLIAVCLTTDAQSSRRRALMSSGRAASSSYSATSTRFTTDDYLTRGSAFTGITDGTNGMLSFWIKSYTSGNVETIFCSSGLDLLLRKTAAGLVQLKCNDNFIPTVLIDMTSTASIEGGAWHHVAMTWSTNADVDCKVYVDGTEGTTLTTRIPSPNSVKIYYSWTTHRISNVGSMNCDVSEFWYAPNQRIDLASNITKFRSSGGAPVSLGSDGSTPTGTAPILYYKDPFTTLVNAGTGGDFTLGAGTLTAGSAIP